MGGALLPEVLRAYRLNLIGLRPAQGTTKGLPHKRLPGDHQCSNHALVQN